MESRIGFVPTNGRVQHPGMDYTRGNIDHLRGRRSIKQVGDDSGVGQSWLQRFMNPDKASGIAKANSVKLGQLARYFGVSVDDLSGRDLTAQVATEAQSQSPRFDDATMSQAVDLLYIMGGLPDGDRFRRITWTMILVAAKAIEKADGDPRGAMAGILAELSEV